MIVVADTTPLNHLILIDQVSLLKALYGRVIIPYAVLSELQDEATPPRVKEFIGNRPDWLEVKHAISLPDSSLAYLDTGERDAIILAQELKADVLLMDDLGGRREAACRNLNWQCSWKRRHKRARSRLLRGKSLLRCNIESK
jgi:predicted nucleic acid-binding protein